MTIWYNVIKIIAILVSLGIAGYSSYLFWYFCSYEFRLCVPIENCTYNVFDYYNEGIYYYQYVVNDEYRCNFLCRDSTDLSSCPVNGTKCHLNDGIFRKCIETGFKDMFDCVPLWEQMILPASMLLIACVCLFLIIILLIGFFENKCHIFDE